MTAPCSSRIEFNPVCISTVKVTETSTRLLQTVKGLMVIPTIKYSLSCRLFETTLTKWHNISVGNEEMFLLLPHMPDIVGQSGQMPAECRMLS